MDAPANKIRLKKRKYYDEYVLTNKHIICKFKYLVVCLDTPSESQPSMGLVNLSRDKLTELLRDSNTSIECTRQGTYLHGALESLQKWHAQLARLEVDCKSIMISSSIEDYAESFTHIWEQLQQLPNNTIKTEQEFEVFKKLVHNVVDVKVYFNLLRPITNVNAYAVNFNYVHKLVAEHILKWNQKEAVFIDEVEVTPADLPFCTVDMPDEEQLCVYPSMYLLPLNPVRE